MTPEPLPPSTSQSISDLLQSLHRRRLVVVLDLMESVRLIQEHEQSTLARWLAFTQRVQAEFLTPHHAQLIKSLGDGLLLQMQDVRHLASLTQQLHTHFAQLNAHLPASQHMWLRIGCHLTDVFAVGQDIYGAGVNLGCRIATLAGPGETVVSAEVRDQLVDGLDAQFTDMGECYLKHVQGAVRCYKLQPIEQPASEVWLVAKQLPAEEIQTMPTVAVLPFDLRSSDEEAHAVGNLIADGVIAQLSRSKQLRVLARLSTQAFRGRGLSVQEVGKKLQADYILTGSYALRSGKLLVQAELLHGSESNVLWSEREQSHLDDLFEVHSQLCQSLAHKTHQVLLETEAQQALSRPIPNLQSYSLFLGGVQLMHRSHTQDFFHSKDLLDALRERHPRSASICAWSSKWFVLGATRGLAQDAAQYPLMAMDLTRRALDLEDQNSFALAMQGFVALHLFKDIPQALTLLEQSLQLNPNDALGNLFCGVAHAFSGNGERALQASLLALKLSPIDPILYYYKSLTVSSAIVANELNLAVRWGMESMQSNKHHASTHRALITALVERNQSGDLALAHSIKADLLQLQPAFTVGKWLSNSPSSSYPFGQRVARALLEVGIPL